MIVMAVAVLTFAACGGSNEDEPDNTSAGDAPACADVWVAGETLPEDYEGCEREDGATEALVFDECTDGSKLTVYDDRYWAFLGDTIKDSGSEDGAANDAEYTADSEFCAG